MQDWSPSALKKAALADYTNTMEASAAFWPVLRLAIPPQACPPPMQRYFRSIQDLSDHAQDFSGLAWVP